MKVYEISLKVFLLNDIKIENSQEKIGEIIDLALGKQAEFLKLHEENSFKYYCFNSFYPLELDGIYKSNKVYTVKIRTISKELAQYFNEALAKEYSKYIKGLVAEVRILPQKHIEKLYTITPLIIKTENGYWKNSFKLEEFEKRIKENLIKKYNQINKTKIDEEFELYNAIEINNKRPIASSYKGKRFLGDKINLVISNEKAAQELAYMALGTGLGEMNARGMGFVNYRWL